MSIYQEITSLIGPVPVGLEPVAWVVAAVVFLFMVSCAFSIVGSVVKWISGRN